MSSARYETDLNKAFALALAEALIVKDCLFDSSSFTLDNEGLILASVKKE